MQVLGLERGDVIISLFAGIVTLASKLGSNVIVNLFCFCSENSANVLTCLMLKQLITGATNGLLPITRGVQISILFFLEGDESMHCSFFEWPLVFEDSLEYQLFSVIKR